MMSWLRAATAPIGFGFTIVQFYEHLQQMPGARAAFVPDAPRYLGLKLTACGVLALLISVNQYWWLVRYFRSAQFASIAGVEKSQRNHPFLRLLPSSPALPVCFPCCAYVPIKAKSPLTHRMVSKVW
jgi:putative membrane protein